MQRTSQKQIIAIRKLFKRAKVKEPEVEHAVVVNDKEKVAPPKDGDTS